MDKNDPLWELKSREMIWEQLLIIEKEHPVVELVSSETPKESWIQRSVPANFWNLSSGKIEEEC